MHGAFAELRDEHNVATSLALRASQGRVTVEAPTAEMQRLKTRMDKLEREEG